LAGGAAAGEVSFRNFTAKRGVAISVPYQANRGTKYDPDTITLAVDPSAPVLEFELTVEGSGFTITSGYWCELDWDDDAPGAPRREQSVLLAGGGFQPTQNVTLYPAWLNLAAGGTRLIRYELDVDEEPFESGWDVERHLQVTFVSSGSNPDPSDPTPPAYPDPSDPTPPAPIPPNPPVPPAHGDNEQSGSGGGCNAAPGGLTAAALIFFLLSSKKARRSGRL
jgi:hypothetical protein